MFMNRIYIGFAAICIGVCSVVFSGCSASKDTSAMPQAPKIAVKVGVLTSRVVDDASGYVGTLKSRKSVVLQPRVAGPITSIFVTAGDVVAAGAPLIKIDPNKQQATVNSMAAVEQSNRQAYNNAVDMLKSLKANRTSQEANLKFAQQQHQRYVRLLSEGAVSQENVDMYANRLKVAEAELKSTDAQIEAQQATIAKAEFTTRQSNASSAEQKEQLRYYTINAPFTGVVGDIPVKLGEYVEPATKLTTLTENRPIECYVYVPTDKARQLKMGTPMQVFDNEGNLLETGKLSFISPSVSADNQSILVKGLFANALGTMRSDQQVKAKIVWSQSEKVMVPSASVAHFAGQDFVFVAQGQAEMVAKQKPVILGEIIGNDYVVVSGLAKGERIIMSGIQNLADGIPIEVQ
jgi:multidrug efflux pump subunit AcrA (membrane-fusion protein)